MVDIDKYDNYEHVLGCIEDNGACGMTEKNKECFRTMKNLGLYIIDNEVQGDGRIHSEKSEHGCAVHSYAITS